MMTNRTSRVITSIIVMSIVTSFAITAINGRLIRTTLADDGDHGGYSIQTDNNVNNAIQSHPTMKANVPSVRIHDNMTESQGGEETKLYVTEYVVPNTQSSGLHLRITVTNNTTKVMEYAADGDPVSDTSSSPYGDESIALTAQIDTPTPELWSPEEPNTYTVKTEVINDSTGDTLQSHEYDYGFRWFDWDETDGLMMNGSSFALNVSALPTGSQDKGDSYDYAMNTLKSEGVNVLLVPYADMTESLLDACNDKGMLVIGGMDTDDYNVDTEDTAQPEEGNDSVVTGAMSTDDTDSDGEVPSGVSVNPCVFMYLVPSSESGESGSMSDSSHETYDSGVLRIIDFEGQSYAFSNMESELDDESLNGLLRSIIHEYRRNPDMKSSIQDSPAPDQTSDIENAEGNPSALAAASMSDATVTGVEKTYQYTGNAIEPVPIVSMYGIALTKDKDYTVSYENNVDIGDGTVVITGINGYTGEFRVKFGISRNTQLSGQELDSALPVNASLDLFDYWLTTEDDYNGVHRTHDYWEKGISKDHDFKFLSDTGPATVINQWTGSSKPRQGIIYPTLQDGYPVVKSEANGGITGVTKDDRLQYLFDRVDYSTNPGGSRNYKHTYANVDGLFRKDSNGYYWFDSSSNYAHYDKDRNKLVLYDTAMKTYAGYGQFFPFQRMEDMFQNDGNGNYQIGTDGKLVGTNVETMDLGPLNHYFGLSLNVPFQQPEDGRIGSDAMTFDFSGDDDVWIFIDGILIADLGGIHNMSTVSIDFNTGRITTSGVADTTIRQQVEDAIASANSSVDASYIAKNFNDGSNTYKDYSTHSLRIFYLERGNNLSNLKMKFNLQYASMIRMSKTDAEDKNTPLTGAVFDVYGDSTVIKDGNGDAIGIKPGSNALFTSAPTDDEGRTDLLFGSAGDYWIHESKAPEGHVKSDDYIKVSVEADGDVIVDGESYDDSDMMYGIGDNNTVNVSMKAQNSQSSDDISSFPMTGTNELRLLAGMATVAPIWFIATQMWINNRGRHRRRNESSKAS